MIRRQCHRAIAESGRDEDREHFLMLPHLFAFFHWPLPPLWGSWISADFPVHLISKPFCIDAPESTTNSRSSGFFSKKVPALPRLRRESRTHVFSFFELIDTFRRLPYSSVGASILFEGFVLSPFIEFWSPRNSLLRFIFLHDSPRWTLSLPNFYVTHRALGELDGVIRPQVFNFPQNRLFLSAGNLGTRNPTEKSLFQQGH